ncbi:MAG: SUMF1/EgtB/PvdO family nonheme iron enzyme [Ignavibacteriales bacterium]|nr:SUMF1/EgtB/PvdO family nonheme iron enzyme [Ignavibacteriales bacterium]
MPNELGIFDMSGNVAEWTFDTDIENNFNRIVKGGTWNSNTSLLKPNARSSVAAQSHGDERMGLRVAISTNR